MTETTTRPAVDAPFFTADGKPIGDRLSEKPIPEKFQKQVEDELRQTTWRSEKVQLYLLNSVKLDMYYGDRDVLYYDEGRDWVVLAHGSAGDERITFILRNLTDSQSQKVTLCTPESFGRFPDPFT